MRVVQEGIRDAFHHRVHQSQNLPAVYPPPVPIMEEAHIPQAMVGHTQAALVPLIKVEHIATLLPMIIMEFIRS